MQVSVKISGNKKIGTQFVAEAQSRCRKLARNNAIRACAAGAAVRAGDGGARRPRGIWSRRDAGAVCTLARRLSGVVSTPCVYHACARPRAAQ